MAREGEGYWYADLANPATGDEYRYRIVNGEQQFRRIDPYARQVTSSVGNSVIHETSFDWGADDYHLPPVNEIVIYEMHLGTFHGAADGKSNKFDEVIQKFDHLQRLGINVIEVMPLAEFAGNISWGYNPACVFAVEDSYGGPTGFKRFVKAAHEAGLGVILDVVYNHFGPGDLDLWQFDGWNQNGQGGIYFYNDWHAETPWGATRPDYGRKEVRQFIRDNALMWLEDYHVDGLRLDMTLFMRNVKGDGDPQGDLPDGWSLVQWINREVQQRFGSSTGAHIARNSDALSRAGISGRRRLVPGFGSRRLAQIRRVPRAGSLSRHDQSSPEPNEHNPRADWSGTEHISSESGRQRHCHSSLGPGGTGDDVVVVVNLSHLAHEMSIVGKESVTTIHTVPTALAV